MHHENRERLHRHLSASGIDFALFASPATITWLTGYAPPIQTGPSPFEGGPALAWWQGGELSLIVSSDEAAAARATGVPVCEYEGYSVERPLQGPQRQIDSLLALLNKSAAGAHPVAIEAAWLTALQLQAIQSALPQATLQPLGDAIELLRAVKTETEITNIRAALALSDMAQMEMKRLIAAGISELALWGEIKGRLEIAAQTRLPMVADLVAGARTAEIGGPPTPYQLQEGDAVIFDVVPRLNGYWGDNAATYFVGTPPRDLLKMRALVWDTLCWGIEQVKPGVVARDLDRMMRERIERAGYAPYPHHTGHGIGVTYHEEPRIVPYHDLQLQPGMVIALEPGIYAESGVRLEHVVLVTADGCEVLTHHLRGGPDA